jgi:predicted MFS family arabinose efflux permease
VAGPGARPPHQASRSRWRDARLALGTAAALGLGRFAYGLVLPAMAADLHWDLARAGTLTTANGVGYLAGALAAAPVTRRLGATATFRLGMVAGAAALAANAVDAGYPALLAARAAAGLAGALVFVAGAVLAPTPAYFAGTGLGIAASGATIPPLLDADPARWPLAWIGLAAAAVLAAAASWGAARPVPAGAGAPARTPVRPLWLVAVAYLLFAAGYIAYITFLSAYLDQRAASAAREAFTWTLLGAAVVAAPVLWQRPIARWPGGLGLAAPLGGLAVAAALPLLTPAQPVVVVSALGYGATFMAVPAAVTAIVRAGAGEPERMARSMAAFTAIFAAGQTVGPWLAGLLADRTTPGATLGWTAALCGAGAALAALARPGTARGSGGAPGYDAVHGGQRQRRDAGGDAGDAGGRAQVRGQQRAVG